MKKKISKIFKLNYSKKYMYAISKQLWYISKRWYIQRVFFKFMHNCVTLNHCKSKKMYMEHTMHVNLDIVNKSVRPFLFTILKNSLYQM